MDAKRATELAIGYFQTVSGSAGPIGFSIESVEKSGTTWIVVCSMWDFLGARNRSAYKLEVDEATEKVLGVSRVQQA